MLGDPLVPLDFGGWFQRVIGVFRRSFRRLAPATSALVASIAAYLILLGLLAPNPDAVEQLLTEASVTPSGKPDVVAAVVTVFGPFVLVLVVFMVLFLLGGGYFLGCSFFVAIREANGQPSTLSEGLRFASRRVLPLVGWTVLAMLLMLLVVVVPAAPGISLRIDVLSALGVLVGVVLELSLGVIIFASLFGVVLIEGSGPRRCARLIKGRFWASLGRLAIAALIYAIYGSLVGGVGALVTTLAGAAGLPILGVVIGGLVQAVLCFPVPLFAAAVFLVTYTELRYWEDRSTTTRSLAAEMFGRGRARVAK